jgi:F0F1-type ATP synthase assembly protein I
MAQRKEEKGITELRDELDKAYAQIAQLQSELEELRKQPEDQNLSPLGVLKDLAITVVILVGAVGVGYVLLYFEVPPWVMIFLVVGDVTLFLQALSRLLRVLSVTIQDAKRPIAAWRDIRKELQTQREKGEISLPINEGSVEKRIEMPIDVPKLDIVEIREILLLLGQAIEAKEQQEQYDEEDK